MVKKSTKDGESEIEHAPQDKVDNRFLHQTINKFVYWHIDQRVLKSL